MGVENLNKIFNPKSIAVVGASEKKESVGYKLLYNLVNAGYKGDIHPVNPGKDMIQGFHAYPNVNDLPGTPDLAIIAVPAAIVPSVVEECGSVGILGLIVKMVDYIIGIAEDKNLESVYGVVMRENTRMIALVESLGFQVKYRGSEAFVALKLR